MRMYDLIEKKKKALPLTKEEIDYMIAGYTRGEIPDYQMSAMMMAVWFRGMNEEETLNLTLAMEHSGDVLDLSAISGIKVDKHSTGGVGDKTSIAITPLVASCGVKIAKMSGRGLGHTGGTIDKLESIPGFRTDLPIETFFKNVNEIGVALMGQTKELAPADKKLYALRDVTATVDNLSLIASSIMSKKLAAGADAIVLDVKTGSGAFMKSEEDARALAEEMVRIGKGAGKNTVAVISDMDEPLGNAVGNALEVREAIDTLNGQGPADFTELVYTLGSLMLLTGGVADNEADARRKLEEAVQSGAALKKLAELVKAQGGDERYIYKPDRLPKARLTRELRASREGFIQRIECDEVGICSLLLGGGRQTKEDQIDLSVGITLLKKTGAYVKEGEILAVLHANDGEKLSAGLERLAAAYRIGEETPEKRRLIRGVYR